ncbi:class I SAM-dependent DNA methyltransferase [Winogradskyella sp. A3E31]|uniref:class I SAM-dependent DNA methyltransferase n=1 Tax=Winogradskyella sp. A3E31 TaxID=3349637 RepID=UPI00398B1EF5
MPNAFDITASRYDDVFTFSNIGKAQRRMVFKYLNPIIYQDKKLSILELNCGTGEDGIRFSKLGHHVIATDISEGMITIAKSKTNTVAFKVQDINAITKETFNTTYDFIFSNFGGFNCLDKNEIQSFFKTAKDLLNPNGKIVLVIMPKHCLWERLYFTLKGNFKESKRRHTAQSVLVDIGGVNVKTWYHNPKDIESIAKGEYHINTVKPIGFTIPPSYLENSIVSKPPFLPIFRWFDSVFTHPFLAKYADHFLIELTKHK